MVKLTTFGVYHNHVIYIKEKRSLHNEKLSRCAKTGAALQHFINAVVVLPTSLFPFLPSCAVRAKINHALLLRARINKPKIFATAMNFLGENKNSILIKIFELITRLIKYRSYQTASDIKIIEQQYMSTIIFIQSSFPTSMFNVGQ